jgi:hypothetical protein
LVATSKTVLAMPIGRYALDADSRYRRFGHLAKHSDEIFELFLLMADRKPVLTTVTLMRLRSHLEQTIQRLDRHIV